MVGKADQFKIKFCAVGTRRLITCKIQVIRKIANAILCAVKPFMEWEYCFDSSLGVDRAKKIFYLGLSKQKRLRLISILR